MAKRNLKNAKKWAFIMAVALIGVIVMVAINFLRPTIGNACYSMMPSEQYDWFTEDIRNKIAGQDVNLNASVALLVNEYYIISNYPNPPTFSIRYTELDYEKDRRCYDAYDYCYRYLRNAWNSAFYNHDIAARYYLFRSDRFINAHPSCLRD